MKWFRNNGGANGASCVTAFTGAAIAMIVGLAPAHAISCVGFVKKRIEIYPMATKVFAASMTGPEMYTTAQKLNPSYVGSLPSRGAIMIFAVGSAKSGLEFGHAAMVTTVIDRNSSILIDHANFEVTGGESYNRSATSSDRWATAKVQKGNLMLGPYKVMGFISPASISIKK